MYQPPDPAQVLLDKAREDHRLAAHLVEVTWPYDEPIGFFCQQAIEKSIKSVLTRRAVPYRRTHDLAELLDLLHDRHIDHPMELERSLALTPFAAEMRYDNLPPECEEAPPFDRSAVVQLAALAIQWAGASA